MLRPFLQQPRHKNQAECSVASYLMLIALPYQKIFAKLFCSNIGVS
jgi:hypothetical protein